MIHKIVRCGHSAQGGCGEILLMADIRAKVADGSNGMVLVCEKCGKRTVVNFDNVAQSPLYKGSNKEKRVSGERR